jgi:hypothetical protein
LTVGSPYFLARSSSRLRISGEKGFYLTAGLTVCLW